MNKRKLPKPCKCCGKVNPAEGKYCSPTCEIDHMVESNTEWPKIPMTVGRA